MRKKTLFILAAILLPLSLLAQEKVDLSIVNRIRTEAFENSKVMDYMFQLTDVNGPRLAGSPAYRTAAEWCVKTLKELGAEDAKLEKWGTLGRGWSCTRFSIHMLAPQQTTLYGIPEAWTPGTNGPVSGDVVLAPIRTEADMEKFKGKLKGKIVLRDAVRELALPTGPLGRRMTDAELAEEAKAPDPARRSPSMPIVRPGSPAGPRDYAEYQRLRTKIAQFLKDEGVLAVLTTSPRGDGGTVYSASGGSRDAKEPVAPTTVSMMVEQYNRMARLAEKNIPVRVELDIKAQFHDESTDGMNVVASLPGGKKADEIVMLGGHLDSWHGGTGATDDAAGVAVALETVRILKSLGVTLDRTVRVGLWDAEEQGLLGSRGYVTGHFADRADMKLKPEHAKLTGYFNVDNGGGKLRGVYLQGNDMMRPIFEAWMAPLRDLGFTTLTIRNTSGTDHLSFDGVGLPGFQFIQDPLDYAARTHHTNLDVYDRIQPGDMMQAAAIMASFVYNAATRGEMLPRKPLPKPGTSRGSR